MPLQNRVTPDARIVAENWRGTMMGNRGGRIHDPETKKLLKRKWASRRWIVCVTQFKERQREVMGHSYTELFFLDEVTALAAGHRPCFECRRKDANDYAERWVALFGRPDGSMADAMDLQLHTERTGKAHEISFDEIPNLPDGAMLQSGDLIFSRKDGRNLQWIGTGYKALAIDEARLPERLKCLTPASTLAILGHGYQPQWHPTAR